MNNIDFTDTKKLIITTIIAIILTVISSGAFFSFVQYLLTRHDNKKNIKGEIEKQMNEGFKEVKADVKETKAELSKDIRDVANGLEEYKAVSARTHILRFADELTVRKHSKEYFEQQLQDIKTYETYCAEHPDFQNEIAKMSIEFIREEYKRLYLNHNDGVA